MFEKVVEARGRELEKRSSSHLELPFFALLNRWSAPWAPMSLVSFRLAPEPCRNEDVLRRVDRGPTVGFSRDRK